MILWDHTGPNRDFLVAFTLVLSAIESAFRRSRNALFAQLFAIGTYLLWALRHADWVGDPLYLSRLSQHLTFLSVHFPGSHWWHAAILPLLLLLLIWTIKQAWDERIASRDARSRQPSTEVRSGRIFLLATGAWVFAVTVFFIRFPVAGLAPWPIRPAPKVSFQERLLTKVSAWAWYSTSLVDDLSPRSLLPYALVRISPDGTRAAYIARKLGLSHEEAVVLSDDRGPQYQFIYSMEFSPDGSSLGYLARTGMRSFAVVNGKKGPDFDAVESLVFSPDGRRSAYVGTASRKVQAVINGQIGPAFDSISGLHFRCDGYCIYEAFQGRDNFDVIEGQEPVSVPVHLGENIFDKDCPTLADVRYTENGKSASFAGGLSREVSANAYVVRGPVTSQVVVGGKRGPSFDRIPYFEVSDNGKTVVYSVFDKRRSFVMVNDHKGTEYDWVGRPVISPDGTTVAFRVWNRYREFIAVNNREGTEFNWVSDPIFSPDGAKLAFAASKGREIWWKVLEVR